MFTAGSAIVSWFNSNMPLKSVKVTTKPFDGQNLEQVVSGKRRKYFSKNTTQKILYNALYLQWETSCKEAP